ncbi:MAG: hypothetical protein ACM3UZ_05820 [Acidobacteriota bacterium]
MREVICALKSNDMLHNQDVVRLKIYIKRKYSNSDSKRRAFILSDAIHRLLDQHLTEFQETHREDIKKRLLHLAVSRGNFSINGQDVFKSCLLIENHPDDLMESMTGWLNARQSVKTIPLSTLKEFIMQIRPYTPDLIHLDLDLFLDHVEEKLAQESQVAYPIETAESFIEISAFEEVVGIAEEVSSDEESIPLSDAVKPAPLNPVIGIVTKTHSDINFLYSSVWASVPVASRSQRMFDSFGTYWTGIANRILNVFQRIPALISSLKMLGFDRTKAVMILVLSALVLVPLLVIIPYISEMISPPDKPPIVAEPDGLPTELRYHSVDTQRLKNYLIGRNSLLAEEPHFSEIIKTSKEFDIHPLLMFAITGQEQGFVPKDSSNAYIKASNPFNVYGSWTEYNGNITNSSRVAAQTVINLSKGRPANTDPFAWINRKYAEDKEWWKGVKSIFEDLKQHVETPLQTKTSSH